MGSKFTAMFFISLIVMLESLTPIYACVHCIEPSPPPHHGHRRHSHSKIHRHNRPGSKHHPHHGGGGHPKVEPPPPGTILPPPPSANPPNTRGPPSGGEGGGGGGHGGGGGLSPPSPTPTPTPTPAPSPQSCPLNAIKMGACVDLLGGLVHIGLGDPVENTCCPLLQGMIELEAAVCLCAAISIRFLKLNIILPIALSVLVICGKKPPPGFVCPA